MCASQAARTDVVKALIQAGARLDDRDRYDRTALMRASGEEVLQALIEAGADVELRYNNGFTMLMRAATMGHVSTVRTLIGAGADVNSEDPEKKTALDLALLYRTRRNELYQKVKADRQAVVEALDRVLPISDLDQVIAVLKQAGGRANYN